MSKLTDTKYGHILPNDMCCRPVNLLQSMHSHFIHTVVFGAMASDILANIFNPTAEFIVDVYSTPWSSSESSVMQFDSDYYKRISVDHF